MKTGFSKNKKSGFLFRDRYTEFWAFFKAQTRGGRIVGSLKNNRLIDGYEAGAAVPEVTLQKSVQTNRQTNKVKFFGICRSRLGSPISGGNNKNSKH